MPAAILKYFYKVAGHLILLLGTLAAFAQEAPPDPPFLAPLFTDNMVMQRDMLDPVWGWTTPGTEVTVSMNGKSASAVAGADGKWMAKIGPWNAGGPHILTVQGPKTVTLKNVLVGDVWLCTGQSNMRIGMKEILNSEQEIAEADQPNIRLLVVQHRNSMLPERIPLVTPWEICTPKTAETLGWNGFSASAYFFGRELQANLKIPIGLIECCRGATVAETWISNEGLSGFPEFSGLIQKVTQIGADLPSYLARIEQAQKEYWAKDRGTVEGWGAKTDLDTSSWKSATLPVTVNTLLGREYSGIIWFSITADLPPDWAGKRLALRLGTIEHRDITFFNGVQVGAFDNAARERNYTVPGELVKAGRNLITLRMLVIRKPGGFTGKPGTMTLSPVGSKDAPLMLKDCKYQLTNDHTGKPPPEERWDTNGNLPSVEYNGMVYPIIPFSVKGAIWYQGESNVGRAKQYRALLPALIADWRKAWGYDFPFHIVQLANYLPTDAEPAESPWAELREAQALSASAIPHCGLTTTIDIGEADKLHPRNKQDVGHRLALSALALTYGKPVEYSGPVFKAMTLEGRSIRLEFDHVADGLVAKGYENKLLGFAICGSDKHYVWADARIDGKGVVVSAPQMEHPVAVRYAWANNPVCNLYNSAGLPAVPFRTDRE